MNPLDALAREMAQMPQAKLVTDHFFIPGGYARRVFRQKGTLIVGKVHRKEHILVIAAGRLLVADGATRREYGPGQVIVSMPGTRRATLALEDSIAITFHVSDETDLDKLEEELVESDDTALFDARNQLRIAS